MIIRMQNRLSQDLIALKGFEASLIKERHSGADRMLAKAGSGVFSETQPHDAITGRYLWWSERQRSLFFSLLAYFVVSEMKPRAAHTPGKILIYQ